jgi:hypothetical protein
MAQQQESPTTGPSNKTIRKARPGLVCHDNRNNAAENEDAYLSGALLRATAEFVGPIIARHAATASCRSRTIARVRPLQRPDHDTFASNTWDTFSAGFEQTDSMRQRLDFRVCLIQRHSVGPLHAIAPVKGQLRASLCTSADCKPAGHFTEQSNKHVDSYNPPLNRAQLKSACL